jgi:hypothetical protein
MGAPLIAFCHIEKAAGTTFIHVLRRAYPMSYIDARPMRRGHGDILNSEDLATLLKCNPFAKAIGGHSLFPHSPLAATGRELKFVTLLRDPVRRVMSHYRFWRHRMGQTHSPEEFLRHHVSRNFQVNKIAGTNDVDRAKEIIRQRFLLIGSVERFDEFLLMFAQRAGIAPWSLRYARKNIADHSSPLDLPDDFESRIEAQNNLDIELYRWVESDVRASNISTYGSRFDSDLAEFTEHVSASGPPTARALLSACYRGLWLKPLSGSIRVINGLTYSGVYAAERGRKAGS